MRQSRLMSLVEAVMNVAVGYGVAVLTLMLVLPLFGLRTTLPENLAIWGDLCPRRASGLRRPTAA